jgi:hypothetical protein
MSNFLLSSSAVISQASIDLLRPGLIDSSEFFLDVFLRLVYNSAFLVSPELVPLSAY